MGQPDLSEKDLLRKNDVFADIINTLLGHGQELIKETTLALAAITKDKRYLELKREEKDDKRKEEEESEMCEVYDMLVKEGMDMAMDQAMEKADKKIQEAKKAAEKEVLEAKKEAEKKVLETEKAAEKKVLETEKAAIVNIVSLMKSFHVEDFEIVQKIRSLYPISSHEAWNYVRTER